VEIVVSATGAPDTVTSGPGVFEDKLIAASADRWTCFLVTDLSALTQGTISQPAREGQGLVIILTS
jgi:hypothetical protein